MSIYTTDFTVTTKDDASPLTEADTASHRILAEALKESYPVLSEEGAAIPYEERRLLDRYWLIDPLDGTKEFIKKNGEFTVNVALIEAGVPLAGWVYVPVTDTLYMGFAEKGARKLAKAGRIPFGNCWEYGVPLPARNAYRPFTVVASRSHLNQATADYIASVEECRGRVERISAGSSLKLCLVAEGAADVYPRFAPTMEWDTAAADAVCRAAGALVLDKETGEPLRYNKKDLHNPHFLVISSLRKEIVHELV